MPHSLRHSGYTPGEPTDEIEYTSSDPNTQLGFEIDPADTVWSFAPEFYPESFTQMKKKKLTRYGGNCGGESVSIKSIKNREFHVTGVLLQGEISLFQGLLDYGGKVDVLSPLTPSGGMECYIKKGELGKQKGFDPHTRQWMFEFTMDLVSTGRDEHDTGKNEIVTEIMGENRTPERLKEG
jgi:hypothetical protein